MTSSSNNLQAALNTWDPRDPYMLIWGLKCSEQTFGVRLEFIIERRSHLRKTPMINVILFCTPRLLFEFAPNLYHVYLCGFSN